MVPFGQMHQGVPVDCSKKPCRAGTVGLTVGPVGTVPVDLSKKPCVARTVGLSVCSIHPVGRTDGGSKTRSGKDRPPPRGAQNLFPSPH